MTCRPYWCHVPFDSASEILRCLEDAHIRSYTTSMYSSHDALLYAEESIVEIVDFDSYWKYQSFHITEVDQFEKEFELSYNKMLAYLTYLATK